MQKPTIYLSIIFLLIITSQPKSYSWPIPHSGQTICYDNEKNIPCPKPGEPFYGQDGNYYINPRSYTKLDKHGNDLPTNAEEWFMVRDNMTGLIWEIKQALDGVEDYSNPHDADNKYNWEATSWTYPFTENNDIERFLRQINDSNFGGFSDWRLPSIQEFASLAKLSTLTYNYYEDIYISNFTYIEIIYFRKNFYAFYWSSTPFAGDNYSHIWGINFIEGENSCRNDTLFHRVRAVRGRQCRTFDHLVNNNDKTFTDTKTGLIWSISTSESKMNWEDSLKYCVENSLAGFSDWRLPKKEELRSIVDYARYDPATERNIMDTFSEFYWSSTSHDMWTGHAWGVNFSNGHVYFRAKSESNYVRTVRGGQCLSYGHLFIRSPMQAAILITGKTIPINWDTADIEGKVKITLSRHGGKAETFETISPGTKNDGHYDWTITGPTSPNCMLKIEPLSNPDFGSQQSFFTIKNPDIHVSTNKQAIFSISGPEKFTATGTSWINDNSIPGDYTITYTPLACWQTPAKESQSLTYWGTLTFSGIYRKILPPIQNLNADREIKRWSENNQITIKWQPIDQCLKGYAFVWDHQEKTEPTDVITGTNHQTISPLLANGSKHWFHIKSINIHGYASETAHIGPFYIGLPFSPHIADTNQNRHIELEEFNTFNSAWKTSIISDNPDDQIHINVMTFSAYLMKMNIDTRFSGDVNHDNRLNQDDYDAIANALENSSEKSDEMDLDENGYLDNQDMAKLFTILNNLNAIKNNTRVLRQITEQNCYASVQIEIIPDNSASVSYAVAEYLPDGCLPSNIGKNGIWNEKTHTITWGTFLNNQPNILSYHLTCRSNTYSITGITSINGLTKTIAGDMESTISCHSVDKAIIVMGGSLDDPRWDRMLKCANYAYNALMYRGYHKHQLLYLNSEIYIDVDQNGNSGDDIYGLSTSENLNTAITSWAVDANNLFIYLIDHGWLGTFLINEYEVLKASELDQWMDLAESRIPGYIYLLYEACFSGSFIAELKNESMVESKRIIMTSASNEDAHILNDGLLSFSYQFWASMFETPYVYSAFTQATSMMQTYQSPLLDADGDGIANEKKDSLITHVLKIGNDYETLSKRPKIKVNQKCLVLNGKTSHNFITEKIVSLQPITKVWATIVPPKKSLPATGNPIFIVPEIALEFTGKEGQYAGIYSEFYENGLYTVSIYAQNLEENISIPAIVRVFSGDVSQWQGDINMDQRIDLSDIIIGLQMLSDINAIETCGTVVSCDGDDIIDMMDILYILSDHLSID
jgi:hypothetical protein